MKRRAPLTLAIGLTGALALAGCSADSSANSSADAGKASDAKPQLTVTGAYMPQPPVTDLAAGFLIVTNKGGADKLTSVTSDISDNISIHKTVNDRMQEVTSFGIPADGTLNLERGGNHIMFMDLKRKPLRGQTVNVELHFEKSGPVKVELPVKEPTYNPPKQ